MPLLLSLLTLFDTVSALLDRARERRRLLSLDDRLLRDIGRSRADAEAEYDKPWWK